MRTDLGPKILILSGRFPPTELPSQENHRAFATWHGYEYIHCDWPGDQKNRYFNKILYLLEYLPEYEYIFWLDDDAFFIDFSKNLDTLVPPNPADVLICRSPTFKKTFTVVSSGQFMVRRSAKSIAFFKDVLNTPTERVREVWKREWGMFTGGDQDSIVFLTETIPRWQDLLSRRHYSSFNSRIEDLRTSPEDVFLLHCAGTRVVKHRTLAEAAQIVGRDRSLIPTSLQCLKARPNSRS